ncbi:MAG TPA: nucleotide sugar dehydrogenase [Candidatus Dormibacteraeota bacterium]|nr:nucleotide sugar dehydrogenase [Candidatus Dormibacteraeota bacterium]
MKPPAGVATRSYRVAVVGLGKIGLPLAAQLAGKGHTVIGCDIRPEVVETVNAGRSHVLEEPGLAEAVGSAVAAGRLTASTDTTDAMRRSEVAIVIVPVVVSNDKRPDYRWLDAALQAVGKGLQQGALVIVETTLPMGATRGHVAGVLEAASGLRAGDGFHLAFSPERVNSGRIFQDLARYPKIVGGIDDESTRQATAFYKASLDAEVRPVANAETAEFAKLAETTYRDVNIALANQLALFGGARGADLTQAFEAANSQPYSHLHRPGIGVGGHCIPVYPHFLLSASHNGELDLVRTARAVNDGMAARCLEWLSEALGGLSGKCVLVLGLSYREDVKELSFSTALAVIDQLRRAGATVLANDPHFTRVELADLEVEVVEDLGRDLNVDAIVVQAFHSEYRALDWGRFKGLKVVLDGRGGVDPAPLRSIGVNVISVAQPPRKGL